MDSENNIKIFTAADIEKYHKGLLSVKEMHDLEKAAMDDPFLADALEGYTVPGVNVGEDIADLKKRLLQRTESAKIIPLSSTKNNKYHLLKVAAMLLFVAGAAFSIYTFGFNKKTETIAKSEPVAIEETKITDTIESKSINTSTETNATNTKELTTNQSVDAKKNITNPSAELSTNTEKESDLAKGNGNVTIVSEAKALPPAPSAITTPIVNEEIKKLEAKDEVNIKAVGTAKKKTAPTVLHERGIDVSTTDDKIANRASTATKRDDDQNFRNQHSNTFRGRIIDQNNIGVPFANVSTLEEKTGTYTDVDGYFNLTNTDSVLNVQVRSIGFESNTVQLRNATATNQVILQNDRNNLSELVIINQKPNYQARANNNTMQLEEPEPADGWTYYDNYLLNNLQSPKEFKSNPIGTIGEVKVSFEVNKKGEPVNFKIEKSLCSKCDKEAIRLIKEGPKWKPKAKNSRTTVTIPF